MRRLRLSVNLSETNKKYWIKHRLSLTVRLRNVSIKYLRPKQNADVYISKA